MNDAEAAVDIVDVPLGPPPTDPAAADATAQPVAMAGPAQPVAMAGPAPAAAEAAPEPQPAADGAVRSGSATRRSWSWTWLPALLSCLVPTVIAGFVISYQASRAQLWRDEFASWSVAGRTVPQIFELGRHIDGVTVPYYLFLHYWIGWFGDSTLSMRTPSIIAMTATAGAVALLGRRLYGNLAGFLAGLLVCAVPIASRYGQEVRGYALAALFATLATLLLVGALAKPRWWRWVLYAGCVALLGLSHQVALLILAGHGVAVLSRCLRRGRLRILWWVLATGAGLCALVPTTLDGLRQRGAQLSWLGPASLDDLANLPGVLLGSALVGGALCAIAAFALPRRGERGAGDGWTPLLWLSALLPYVLLFVVDQLIAPIFLGRYLLFIVPLLCVLAGRGLATLRVHTALAVGLAVAAVGLPAQVDVRTRHSVADYRSVAQLLRVWGQPGDGVIYTPRSSWQFTDEAMRYYLGEGRPKDVLLATDEVQNASLWANECTDGAACIAGTPRVWTVTADDLLNPGLPSSLQLSLPEQDALATYRRVERWDLNGFLVSLYLPRPVKSKNR